MIRDHFHSYLVLSMLPTPSCKILKQRVPRLLDAGTSGHRKSLLHSFYLFFRIASSGYLSTSGGQRWTGLKKPKKGLTPQKQLPLGSLTNLPILSKTVYQNRQPPSTLKWESHSKMCFNHSGTIRINCLVITHFYGRLEFLCFV